ncbi:hypothetical protein BGZ93_008905 [Podila epicladia]|nr:hypothetical protein BGZ92_009471 [Podila epicladia]KAG0091288.1 hypothetical protein BGZ93_008905 [Podila epicladia]
MANGPKTGSPSELDNAIDTIMQMNLCQVDSKTIVSKVDVQFLVDAVKGRLHPLFAVDALTLARMVTAVQGQIMLKPVAVDQRMEVSGWGA